MERQFKVLSTHMITESPFLSMLNSFTSHVLKYPRPQGVDWHVWLTGKKVAIVFASSLFKQFIYGGLAYDEMIQAFMKIGLDPDCGFYRVTKLQQSLDTFAFVGKHPVEKICMRLHPLKSYLNNN